MFVPSPNLDHYRVSVHCRSQRTPQNTEIRVNVKESLVTKEVVTGGSVAKEVSLSTPVPGGVLVPARL